jgi:hypothetical protein
MREWRDRLGKIRAIAFWDSCMERSDRNAEIRDGKEAIAMQGFDTGKARSLLVIWGKRAIAINFYSRIRIL